MQAEATSISRNGCLHANLMDKDITARRKSVDVGGLALAFSTVSLGEDGMGKGFIGWDETETAEPVYAQLLSDMYTHTQSTVSVPIEIAPLDISAEVRDHLITALDSWHFEPHKLPEEQVLACTEIIFEALYRVDGMFADVGIPLVQLNTFLRHLRQVYRSSNSYHNFQHALDVFQATHNFLMRAGVVPPIAILRTSDTKWTPSSTNRSILRVLRNEDLFALYIAAIGHDVGHPGFNNIFMKNAQTPLSQVYDHKSALEHMHLAILVPIMKQRGFGHLFERPERGSQFRKLLLETVLATDMGVHAQFMQKFQHFTKFPQSYDFHQTRILLCQALIKCADISNPSRPHTVSQHWSAALGAEWEAQALLEKHLSLPVSVQICDDPIAEARGQVGFITHCTCPLFQLTAIAVPEMSVYADQCATNRSIWQARLDDLLSKHESDLPNYPPVPYRSISPQQPQDYLTVFPLTLPTEFIQSEGSDTSMTATANRSPNGSMSHLAASRSPSPFLPAHNHAIPSISTNSISASSPTSLFSHSDITSATSSSPASPRSDRSFRLPAADSSTSLRAAVALSVRNKKSFHRSSWTPSPSSLSASSFTFPPLMPTFAANRSPLSPESISSSYGPSPISSALSSSSPMDCDPLH